jgi:dihydroorotate dehydrogenase
VVATNTLGQPSPDDTHFTAGVGGGRLRPSALRTVEILTALNAQMNKPLDIIGCGGIMDGETWRAYTALGVGAVQYWSALVYRGPLAAALIAREGRYLEQPVRNRQSAPAN